MHCIFVRVKPDTEEWDSLRRGRLTASRAGDWCAKPTTKRYQQYMEQVVLELLGFEEKEETARWFEHGKAMEPFARGAYEWKTGTELDNELFLIHPEHDWLGCSPDGVHAGMDGMVEFKCRSKLHTYHNIVAAQQRTGKIESAYRYQVQCQMLVSGLSQIEFGNYYHDHEQMVRKLDIFLVDRDDKMISRIEEKAIEFMTECYKLADMKMPKRKAG